MRPSEMGTLAQCEALWLANAPEPGPMSAAAYVGLIAHAILLKADTPAPSSVAWDDITRNRREAFIQGNDLADRARALINEADLIIITTETDTNARVGAIDVRGRFDLLLGGGGRKAVVDLKTGHTIGGAWLQVGGYLLDPDLDTYDGGVLHVPRSRHEIIRSGSLQIRDGAGLRKAAQTLAERGSNIVNGQEAARTPGRHCARCPLTDCAVRI